MSEYQNRAVELMQTLIGNQSTADINDRRNAFIFRAIGLYQALGGDPEAVQGVVEKVYAVRAPRIDTWMSSPMSRPNMRSMLATTSLRSTGTSCRICFLLNASN